MDNRRRDSPKNHFPLAVTEIVSAYDELNSEGKAAAYRTRLLNPVCQTCRDAEAIGRLCPFHHPAAAPATSLPAEVIAEPSMIPGSGVGSELDEQGPPIWGIPYLP